MRKKGILIISAALIVWSIFFMTDFILSKANQSPIFAFPLVMYKDGGTAEYYGLGYKVIKYVNLTVERGSEVVKVDFGSWLMEFSHPLPTKAKLVKYEHLKTEELPPN